MKNLLEVIKETEARETALGHFNISDIVALKAVFEAARELGEPVIIGTSEGEREFLGVKQAVALVKSFREEYNFPIFLNADHTHSLEKVREAAKAGYDAVLFDGGKLSFKENIKQTKAAVELAKSINPEILVEGEIGYIGASSEIFNEVPAGAALKPEDLTTPEQAAEFVEKTGVDLLAPAVGNIHGMLVSAPNPPLDIKRIEEIKKTCGVPLVLHGGSGIVGEDIVAAIKAGISIIHINTEIRVAWRSGLEEGLKNKPDEVAPYKIYPAAVEAIKGVVLEKLKLFG